MSRSTDNQEKAAPSILADEPSADEVKAFLQSHPGFIADNPDLLAALVPPENATGRNIVDMQHFMIARLQREVRTLRDIQTELLDAASVNSLARERVHKAVLALIDSRSFEVLVDYITRPGGLAATLDVCVAALAVENETAIPGVGVGTVRMLEPDGVDRLTGGENRCRLNANIQASRGLYGPIGSEVRSEALIRLDVSPKAPACLLALGSREPWQFHPDQAHDLLDFLGGITERCFRLWLDLPADT